MHAQTNTTQREGAKTHHVHPPTPSEKITEKQIHLQNHLKLTAEEKARVSEITSSDKKLPIFKYYLMNLHDSMTNHHHMVMESYGGVNSPFSYN